MRFSRKAVFLDRDGVINRDDGYVHRIEDFVLLPGAVEGMRLFQSLGYLLVIITNQSGIARGYFSEAEYGELTRAYLSLLAADGVDVARVYHCPHLASAEVPAYRLDCECRKPRPGMILKASEELGIDLPDSLLVGDRARDIQAGRIAGVGRCFVVRSPLEADEECEADLRFGDLLACATFVAADDQAKLA